MPLYNVYGEKKKKNKGPSDMSTTAKLALAAHTAIITGSIGFGDVIHNAMKLPVKISQEEEQDLAMKYVDENIIGRDLVYKGPYGCRKGKQIFQYYSYSYILKLRYERYGEFLKKTHKNNSYCCYQYGRWNIVNDVYTSLTAHMKGYSTRSNEVLV